MKLAALLSGGKDSLYALYRVSQEHEVMKLISVESVPDSKFFHRENIELVKLQSEALDIPLTYRKTSEEEELDVLEESIGEIRDSVDGVVSGAVASSYQKEKIERICRKHGLKALTPLWHVDEEEYMERLIEEGFEVMVTKVAAEGLGKEWLGRILDRESLEELKKVKEKYGIHLAGEGGEYETLVVDCPLFRKRIEVEVVERKWNGKTKSGRIVLSGRLGKRTTE